MGMKVLERPVGWVQVKFGVVFVGVAALLR